MSKFNLITIIVAFLTFTVVFNITRQPDIIVPDERIETAVSDILGNDIQYDETEIQQIVTQAIQILNDGQSRRLKYLISAYFVAWLILMLYIFLQINPLEHANRLLRSIIFLRFIHNYTFSS